MSTFPAHLDIGFATGQEPADGPTTSTYKRACLDADWYDPSGSAGEPSAKPRELWLGPARRMRVSSALRRECAYWSTVSAIQDAVDEALCKDWKCGVISLMYALPRTSAVATADVQFVVMVDAQEPAGLEGSPVGAAVQRARELRVRFEQLARLWHERTGHLSSITAKAMDEHYQNIIGIGPDAVPLILHELEERPDHWFWALTAITGEDPVAPEDAGDLERMAQAWLRFGRERGYL
jgi:hypothetical protein